MTLMCVKSESNMESDRTAIKLTPSQCENKGDRIANGWK